jgi:hypothetical protein
MNSRGGPGAKPNRRPGLEDACWLLARNNLSTREVYTRELDDVDNVSCVAIWPRSYLQSRP